MNKEKPKEEYYREAAQFLNTGERVGADSGEGAGGTLAFLTRGIACFSLNATHSRLTFSQEYNSWRHGPWMTRCDPSREC